MRATRDYPLVQRYTSPMLRVFAELARMHSAYLHEAIPVDAYEDSIRRCEALRGAIERRIVAEAGCPQRVSEAVVEGVA